METFKTSDLKHKAYRSVIVQKGGNNQMNHFINNMRGEGLGNYFGTTMRQTIPLTVDTIKGGKQRKNRIVVTTTSKRKAATSNRSKNNQVIVHTPHKKVKRSKKWRNL